MRRATLLFILLLAGCADNSNQLVPGTDILIREHGYVAGSWNADKNVRLAKIAVPDAQGSLAFNEITFRCKEKVAKDRANDWTPVSAVDDLQRLYNVVCS